MRYLFVARRRRQSYEENENETETSCFHCPPEGTYGVEVRRLRSHALHSRLLRIRLCVHAPTREGQVTAKKIPLPPSPVSGVVSTLTLAEQREIRALLHDRRRLLVELGPTLFRASGGNPRRSAIDKANTIKRKRLRKDIAHAERSITIWCEKHFLS